MENGLINPVRKVLTLNVNYLIVEQYFDTKKFLSIPKELKIEFMKIT